jgi:uncharacterized protein with PIN domain
MRIDGNITIYDDKDSIPYEGKAKICKKCIYSSDSNIQNKAYTMRTDFARREFNKCPYCNNDSDLIYLNLTVTELKTLKKISLDPDFILTMDKLKTKDIIEFNLKMSQFKQSTPQQPSQSTESKPKCPTCGSPDIKKISATKRWVGVGMFGLASSDVGKTMQCNNCGYKW